MARAGSLARVIEDIRRQLGNLWALTVGGGIAPPYGADHVVLHTDEHRGLRRYGGAGALAAAREAGRAPVLLVPPIAAPASCYDLGPDASIVAHLADTGRVPYVLDFGEIAYSDRGMGFEDFIMDIIPQAIERVAADFYGPHEAESPADREVDLLGWSLGGTLSVLTAAVTEAPIRSITTVATPLDYGALAPYPAVRALTPTAAVGLPAAVLKLLGGIPAPLVRVAYRATSWDRELKKPWFVLTHLREPETLARMETIDRFQRTFPAYPGRLAQQMWEEFVIGARLETGKLTFGDLRVDLSVVDVPVQLVGSHRDALCSWEAAEHGLDLFSGSPRVRFTTVESSHLGLIAGPDAAAHTWPAIDAFLASVDDGARTRA